MTSRISTWRASGTGAGQPKQKRATAIRNADRRTSDPGFTLIELLLVLVLLGTLVTLAIPRIGASRIHRALEDAATQLASDLRTARIEAIETGVPRHIEFRGAATGGYEIVVTDVEEHVPWDFSRERGDGPARYAQHRRWVEFESEIMLQSSLSSLRFTHDGSAQDATLLIRDANRTLTVTVAGATGHITIVPSDAERSQRP